MVGFALVEFALVTIGFALVGFALKGEVAGQPCPVHTLGKAKLAFATLGKATLDLSNIDVYVKGILAFSHLYLYVNVNSVSPGYPQGYPH